MEPLDLLNIEQTLSIDGLTGIGNIHWLEESYAKPELFWKSLKQAHDDLFKVPGKSVPFQNYDFYHDIVGRNRNSLAPAFRWREETVGWREVSYARLAEQVDHCAASWKRQGLSPGRTVCILYPFGIQFLVSLLAGFKLGLVLSFLPPEGRAFIRKRLDILKPDAIAMEKLDAHLAGPWQDIILQGVKNGDREKLEEERSYTYSSGEVVALCFDLSSDPPHLPKPLMSDAAYLCPLRDGLISLHLRPGDGLAAPGFHFMETQPALVLSCLINGAVYNHLEARDIQENPHSLFDHSMVTLGVSIGIRDLLMEHPVTLGGRLNFWFRTPSESMDLERWQSFMEKVGLENTRVGNLAWNNARGGCILFSVKRKGRVTQNVLPAPGVPWILQGFEGGDSEAMGTSGLFAPAEIGKTDGEPMPAPNILAKFSDEWLYVGYFGAGRSGRCYPKNEVMAVVSKTPSCALCAIVDMAVPENTLNSRFFLLIFTGSKKDADQGKILEDIRVRLLSEMGDAFFPDRTLFFPLYPRFVPKKGIDHEWCRTQFITGQLTRKSKESIYSCLALLHECCSREF